MSKGERIHSLARSQKIILIACAGFLVFSVLAVCDRKAAPPPPPSPAPSSPPAPPPPKEGEFRVSRAEFFDEQTRALAHHLGLTGGAVKIEYSGPKEWVWFGCETWQNGQPVPELRGGERCGRIEIPLTSTAMFSLEDVTAYTGEPKYRVVFTNENGSMTQFMPKPETTNKAYRQITLARTVDVPDDKEHAVWAVVGGEGIHLVTDVESIEDNIKRVEWAIVFKVKFVDR